MAIFRRLFWCDRICDRTTYEKEYRDVTAWKAPVESLFRRLIVALRLATECFEPRPIPKEPRVKLADPSPLLFLDHQAPAVLGSEKLAIPIAKGIHAASIPRRFKMSGNSRVFRCYTQAVTLKQSASELRQTNV